jgi:hypothetical protein
MNWMTCLCKREGHVPPFGGGSRSCHNVTCGKQAKNNTGSITLPDALTVSFPAQDMGQSHDNFHQQRHDPDPGETHIECRD